MWQALKRGGWRIVTLAVIALVLYQLAENVPALFGPILAPAMFNLALLLWGWNAQDIVARLTMPYSDMGTAWRKAMSSSPTVTDGERISASILFFARVFMAVMLYLVIAFGAKAETAAPQRYGATVEHLYMDSSKAGKVAVVPFLHTQQLSQAQERKLNHLYQQAAFERDERELRALVVAPVIVMSDMQMLLEIQKVLDRMETRVKALEQVEERISVLETAPVAAQAQPVAPAAPVYDVSKMPPNAQKNYHLLMTERGSLWPSMLEPSSLGGQVEQETCYSLKHPKCWSANAELNITSKHGTERGCGFGQLTKVVRANGQLRFDNLSMMRLKYPKELGTYTWDNCNDPVLAMRAYVLFMRDTCKNMPKNAASVTDMFQMCLSAYNGGEGGLRSDILSCRATSGCDPTRWKGNVELTSAKSKTRVPGYGQPAFDINRGYVTNVTEVRRPRYLVLDKMVLRV